MIDTAKPVFVAFGLKVLGAIAIYIVGRWLIGIVGTVVRKAFERQKVEPTVSRYVGNTINIALNVLLIIGILGYFGVETTSFAALIAAIGIAIGAAWSGMLANFAAGAFILVFRPFKVGDYVSRGRGRRHGAGRGDVHDDDRLAGQRADLRRQREGHGRHDQELLGEPVPPRRPDRAARPQRRSCRRGAPAQGSAAEDRERRPRHRRPTSRS